MQDKAERLDRIRRWVHSTKEDSRIASDVTEHAEKPNALGPIAITGVSGFFPGCMDVAAFWEQLDRDASMISEIPEDRFDWRAYWDPSGEKPGSMRSKWGGFIPDIASFDPERFGILPMEADEMDPRQRLLLMSTWQTLLDASIEPESLKKSNTGVFIACEANEYAQLMGRASVTPKMGMSQTDSMIANRISYQFDFAGPSEMINATCAGFSVALHRAVVNLRAGLIDRAIVGAANLILLPDPYVVLSETEQLSPHATVHSFGAGGDGFVRSEGVGTILIERLSDAEAAQRKNYAVIKHTAVNFNGQGGVSMASPNIDAHTDLLKKCYREAGIDPRQLSYIEAQGMGLPVADIAEWTAMNRALQELCIEQNVEAPPGFCRVSTLKPMLGHMHAASSLGALLKILRSFQTGKIHKILDYGEPNTYCDMEHTPCRIASETEIWESDGVPRLAALHSYGSGGNNAHILLEEGQAVQRIEATEDKRARGDIFNKRRCWFQAPVNTEPALVSEVIRDLLGLAESSSTLDTSFLDLGLDSLSVDAFVSKLKDRFVVPLRKSDVFSHSTPRKMAAHVSQLMQNRTPPETVRPQTMRPHAHSGESAAATDSIAIIGMSLRVAGAENVDEYWDLLKEGRCAISSLPVGRRPAESEILKNAKGGFLSDISTFDPLFFNISPKECANMDPRHRVLLEAAWSAIEDSGYNPADWKDAQNGIFVGIEESDYPINAQSAITSVHGGTAPARIGYFLDTKGPLLALSTACSSSLVAVHTACKSILSGESDSALAGGCNLISQPERTFFALSQMGEMLSPDGTCYAFDQRANGMVIGEGVGMVVLKRLSAARRDGDSVYGVIQGSGINYDGRTNGLTAPNGARQRELYERVYKESGVRPEQISYVVSHGTGTSLGDPIECNALMDAFGQATDAKQYCALTSPKSNIGHTQAAAGIVNLITAALALQKRQIPPTLNFETANEDIGFAESPFYVNTALKNWDTAERYAAVSSFGHTGTNAHVLLGEADSVSESPTTVEPVCIVLSAKSLGQLRQSAQNLLQVPVCNLRDLAYTLQVGREAMQARLAFVVSTWAEFQTSLSGFLEGKPLTSTPLFAGEVEAGDLTTDLPADVAAVLKRGDAAQLAEMWTRGAAIDWIQLYQQKRPIRLHLPTYPFEKERYWLDDELAPQSLAHPPVETVAEPGEPFEVMTFEEVLQQAPVGPLRSETIRTLVVALSDAPNQREFLDELRAIVPAETSVLAVQESDCNGYLKAFEAIQKSHGTPDAILYMHTFDDADKLVVPDAFLGMIQAINASSTHPERILFAAPFMDDIERCMADAWIGFERSMRLLMPKTRMTVVGLDEDAFDDDPAAIMWEELNAQTPASVFYLKGKRSGFVIQPTALKSGATRLKEGGTYLITGGLGSLGYLFAEYLSERYKSKLILMGRSPVGASEKARLAALKELGGDVRYLQADIADFNAVKLGLESVGKLFGPVQGVIHAAGIEGTEPALKKSGEDFQKVLQAKVQGTLVLDAALNQAPLDFVAYFTSSAAILGDLGVCDYAMASRFEMAYARYRNAMEADGMLSGKAVVFNWPMWEAGGMVDAQDNRSQFYLKTSGQRALMSEEGIELFERGLVEGNVAQHLVLAGRPQSVHRFLGLTAVKSAEAVSMPAGAGRRPEMKGFSVEECIEWDLKDGVHELLKIDRNKLKVKTNLSDYGFDSMSLAEYAEWLSNHYSLEITPALFFGHSTIARLANYFLTTYPDTMEALYAKGSVVERAASRPSVAASQTSRVDSVAHAARSERSAPSLDEPIAIIGMSGRFPQARNIDEMWSILAEGKDAVEEIPLERFDWRLHYGDPSQDTTKTNGKWCGILPGVAEFDPLFFEISPREAASMDPRQRHLLQESWNALEDAGYGPQQIENQKIGMFVGVEEGDYVFLAEEGEITSNHSGILSSRLAYFLDLKGPVLATNTACSSGLVAAHQACQSLRNRECETALVAGVNLHTTAAGLVAMGQSGMLSDEGKCYTFDKRANGMVPGEAVVAMVLKPLAQAEADGDPIHAVIRASGINYDGKTNGITAPSTVSQADLLNTVYDRGRIDPESLDYIVTHGTGTKLGDPVEINALAEVFKSRDCEPGSCALTSTKTNFGHTFAASGLLSAVSLVEALRHETIPASLHCESESDYINWSNTPFYVNKQSKAWPRTAGRRRMGAVSAFGMSGTNAHMVVEEYSPTAVSNVVATPYYLLVLSAKTEQALLERTRAMVEFLDAGKLTDASLAAMSHTLLEGRHHLQYRSAIVVEDPDDARLIWKASLDGATRPNQFAGRVSQDFKGLKVIRKQAEALLQDCSNLQNDSEAYQETLFALADFYCQGYELPWRQLFAGETPRRIALPTYPFARESYWLAPKVTGSTATLPAAQSLHPLVHRNISDFEAQCFASTFTGQEFFFAEHKVQGTSVLPGVSYLEMARAAVAHSLGAEALSEQIVLSQIVWVSPFSVGAAPRELCIALMDQGRTFAFEVYSHQNAGEEQLHCQGLLEPMQWSTPPTHDLTELRSRMQRGHPEVAACYSTFAAAGLDYGAAFQGLRDVQVGDAEVLAEIALPESVRAQFAAYGLHPSILDAAFQATVGLELFSEHASEPRIPFSLERVEVLQTCPENVWVWVRPSPGVHSANSLTKLDLDICDAEGQVCIRMQGFSTRAISSESTARPSVSRQTLTGDEFYLKDHGGLLPGVVSLEWARAAGSVIFDTEISGLKQVVWSQPISVTDTVLEVETSLRAAGADYDYQVKSGALLHAQGKVVTGTLPEQKLADLSALRALCTHRVERADYDVLLQSQSIGPSLVSITEFTHGTDQALASLVLPAAAKAAALSAQLHPSLMNGALQVANILSKLEDPTGGIPVPFSLDALWIYQPIPDEVYVSVRKQSQPSSGPKGARVNSYDIDILDQAGQVMVAMRGYTSVTSTGATDHEMVYAIPQWQLQPLSNAVKPDTVDQASPYIILSEPQAELVAALHAKWPKATIKTLATEVSFETHFLQLFKWVQAQLGSGAKELPPIYILMSPKTSAAEQTAYAGLLKTARMEKAGFRGKVISYADESRSSLDWLAAEFADTSTELEVRYDQTGARHTRVLEAIELPPIAGTSCVRAGDVIWITGGLGGLGRVFAAHFGIAHQARIVLSGRSALNDEKAEFLQSLRQRGADVRYMQGDLAEQASVDAMLVSILETEGALTGILHSAGIIEDAYIIKKAPEAVSRVLQPKVAGTLALDAATRELELDFFICFSSLTGSFGNPGQADYAGANAFLDGFAEHRNQTRPGRTLSVNWPLWREGGMGMDAQSERLLKQNSGMVPMESSAGVAALERALSSDHSQVLVLQGEGDKLRETFFRRVAKPAPTESKVAASPSTVAVPLEKVYARLVAIVAEQQRIPSEKIELDVELSQYGYNSLELTALANRLNAAFGLSVMPTLFFEHSNLKSLGRHLADVFSESLAETLAPTKSSEVPARVPALSSRRKRTRFASKQVREVEPPATKLAPIAIVGVDGRFPGSVDLAAFWKHLEANHDLISEVPKDRWNWEDYFGDPADQPGKTKVKSAGFMEGVDRFDAAFFGISPREAIAMDPQFRLLLESIWSAIEDAGYRPSDLAGSRTGVFTGVSTSDYKDAWLQQMGTDLSSEGPPFVSHFVLPNRISYILDLHGPSEPIDTACSSSLVAIHRAIEAIRQGNCDQALVGGVNVISSPNITLGASRAGMLSEDGRCKTFDKSADGYGRGEGVGAVFLKPLDVALEAGDTIYGLIRGSSENHGGKANSPTSPNPAAQKALLVDAYTRAGIDPRTVGYIETHGTGTELGDPIEINGLRSAFQALYEAEGVPVESHHCALGSVKTNIGHLEAAAGMAGLMKVLLMLRHRKIPGNVHLKEPNPYLELETTPFYLAQTTRDWEASLDAQQQTLPRRAGVSSFGIGGSNAHIILEEYVGDTTPPAAETTSRQIIVLSAKNEDRLKVAAKNLLAALHNPAAMGHPDFEELAYTLQVGREAFEARVCFAATSFEELVAILSAFIGGRVVDGVHYKRLKRLNGRRFDDNAELLESVERWTREGAFDRLLELWCRGVELDWKALHGGRQLRRINLPTYPFDRKRFWFNTPAQAAPVRSVTDAPESGPLAQPEAPQPQLDAKPRGIALTPLAAAQAAPNSDTSPAKSGKVKLEATPMANSQQAPVSQAPVPKPTEPIKATAPVPATPKISKDSLENELIRSLAEILYMEADEIERDSPFIDLGLDSVIGVEWIQSINKRYGIKITATKVYDYPSVEAMAGFLVEQIAKRSAGKAVAPVETVENLSLDEVLDRVQQNKMTIEEADKRLQQITGQSGDNP